MEALDADLARKTVKNYACSNCWGDLEITPDMRENGMYFVVCQKCQDETKGYVTKYFVAKQRTASEFEKRDAVRMLQDIGVLPPREKKPAGAMLKELGF